MNNNMPNNPGGDKEIVDILGLWVCPLRTEELNSKILGVIKKRERAIIPNINVYFATLVLRQPWLRDFFNLAPFNFCDGVGIILGARLLGKSIPERITYADWMWSLAELAETNRLRLFFLGGRPGLAALSAQNLKKIHPGLQVVGTGHGYFDKADSGADNMAVIREINQSHPHILITAFGMPLQEKWLQDNWHNLNVNIGLTGGAVFDYLSGWLRRPPLFLRRLGLEWLGRLFLEPKRLWRRYLIGIPIFLWHVLKQRLKLDGRCKPDKI